MDTFAEADKRRVDGGSSLLTSQPRQMESMFDTLYDDLGTGRGYEVFGEVPGALSRLSVAGVAMGVLSNSDERVASILEDVGLRHHFDFVLSSKEVSCFGYFAFWLFKEVILNRRIPLFLRRPMSMRHHFLV